MRRLLPFLGLLLLFAGSAPAAVGPPRLLGLSISNGGQPFLGDTRQLATVSPNGDGLRDRALIRFHLDQAARLDLRVVATSSYGKSPTVVWRLRRTLAPGPHALTWRPKRDTADRTYLLRFVVRGKNGLRVYGFERPRPGRPTSGLVVRILGVDVAFQQRSYVPGSQASASIATDARTVRVQFFGYPGVGELDPKTGASAMTPAVTLDWRGHRGAPHVVAFGGSEGWASGLYFLRATTSDGRVGYAPVVLRPRRLGEHRVAVVLPTNTWQADNLRDSNGDGWGDSWNANRSVGRVDLRRPYLDAGLPEGFLRGCGAVIGWLTRTGKQADYLSDDDLAAVSSGDALRRGYDLVVFAGSEEYVGRRSYDVVRRFRDLGGRLMFLSAANFHWRAEGKASTLRLVRPWRQLGKPEAALVGAQVTATGRGGGKPYVVRGASAAPWAFAGTGLVDGSTFGRFGTEIDATTRQSPAGTIVLARIQRAIGRRSAEMTYYDTAAGSRVFAAGVLNFASALDEPPVAGLLQNMWARLTG